MNVHTKLIIKTLCLVLFSFLFIASKPKNKPEQQLVSKWKYTSGSGGFTGKGPAWDAAKGIYFEFKKNGTFKKTEHKKVVQTDTYRIEKIKRTEQADEVLKVVFKKQISMLAYLTADTLSLQEDVADGFTYNFVRCK